MYDMAIGLWLLGGGVVLVAFVALLRHLLSREQGHVRITVRRDFDTRPAGTQFGKAKLPALVIEVANGGSEPLDIAFPVYLLLPTGHTLPLTNRALYQYWPADGRLFAQDMFRVYVPRHEWGLYAGTLERRGFEVLVADVAGGKHRASVSPAIQRWLEDARPGY
jgi:hypothetical protein